MTPGRLSTVLITCAAAAVLAGCGTKGEDHEPAREGIAAPLGGLDYNVFITRQLNPKDVEDRGYYTGPEESGECAGTGTGSSLTPEERPQRCPTSLFGVFIEVCNEETDGAPVAAREPRVQRGVGTDGAETEGELGGDFEIEDSQGNKFEPIALPPTNVFAYRARPLKKNDCIPASGSAAATAPTGGSMLLFRLPVAATENRPLELSVSVGGETRKFELDI
jgi:hypothetical protein